MSKKWLYVAIYWVPNDLVRHPTKYLTRGQVIVYNSNITGLLGVIINIRMNSITKGRFASPLVAMVFATLFFVVPALAHAQYSYDGKCCSSYTESFYPSYTESYYPSTSYTESYYPSYTESYYPTYESSYYPSYDSSYYPSYDSSYYPSYDTYAQDPYYVGSGGESYYSGYPVSYGSSYPAVTYSTAPAGYSYGGGSYYTPSYSAPTKTPTVSVGVAPIGKPTNIAMNQSQDQDQNQAQDQNQSQSSYNSNSNTNNNTSSSYSNSNSESNASAYQTLSNVNNIPITNVNSNPINNVNKNNVSVNVSVPEAKVLPYNQTSVVQYPIQYVFPQQPQYYPNAYQPAPYCTITVTSGAVGYNQPVTLSWSSNYATSAYISPSIGSVTTSGTRTVYPVGNQVYSMTVYGYNGQTATCQTTAFAPAPLPTPLPQVSLTQIPYTGFDFGTFGNSIYWASLIAFALAAAYLVVYFRGGAGVLATTVLGRTSISKDEYTVPAHTVTKISAPVAASVAQRSFDLPVAATDKVTVDSMSVATAEGGMPRIVINRN